MACWSVHRACIPRPALTWGTSKMEVISTPLAWPTPELSSPGLPPLLQSYKYLRDQLACLGHSEPLRSPEPKRPGDGEDCVYGKSWHSRPWELLVAGGRWCWRRAASAEHRATPPPTTMTEHSFQHQPARGQPAAQGRRGWGTERRQGGGGR